MRDDRERLLHIQDAIANIEKYTGSGRDTFDRDELIQNWVLRHIQIIGERCEDSPPISVNAIPKCLGRR
jgi:uncharacterized protein with HEPN domain